jgi:peroxygenase
LQQHVLFWDRDGDNQIWPRDVYSGFRELGFNMVFSFLALLINLFFSYPTRLAHTWVPDPYFRLFVDGIHKAKHGSDTGVYDPEGRFIPQNFENIFSRYDKEKCGALSFRELRDLMHGQRCAADPYGVRITNVWGYWLTSQVGSCIFRVGDHLAVASKGWKGT